MCGVQSSLRDKTYETKDAIRILNPKQAAFYWGNGCPLLDIYISKDYKTGEPVIVYIFNRDETQSSGAYDAWCRNKPNGVLR